MKGGRIQHQEKILKGEKTFRWIHMQKVHY